MQTWHVHTWFELQGLAFVSYIWSKLGAADMIQEFGVFSMSHNLVKWEQKRFLKMGSISSIHYKHRRKTYWNIIVTNSTQLCNNRLEMSLPYLVIVNMQLWRKILLWKFETYIKEICSCRFEIRSWKSSYIQVSLCSN